MSTSVRSGAAADSAAPVVIVDAGVGNLGNLQRAIQSVVPGLHVDITADAQQVQAAAIVLLPGVGAFRPPRERLRGALERSLREAVENGAFLMGICVGFQLLFEASDEFGETDGLGFFSGRITSLPETVSIPHIGWNRLTDCRDHPLLEGVHDEFAYFVHSFAPTEVPEELQLAHCVHGTTFPAVVAQGRVMGTQFHPEKSGAMGLRILKNFLSLAGAIDV